MIRIAINGLGRIGKSFLRAVMQDAAARKKIEVVAINIGPGSLDLVAHTFKYDTLMGTYQGEVQLDGKTLVIDGYRIPIYKELDPEKLPWKQLNIDWVVECTGHFTKREGASKHIKAGAKKVLISAPASDDDVSIIPGVNMQAYDKQKHVLVSLGSCSTNAFVPVADVLQKTFGIEHGFVTTIHAYTNTQALLDIDLGDARRNRAAALNIVPTTTGATAMVGKIIPELIGCIQGHSVRVPVGKVSLLDFGFLSKKEITVATLNKAFEQAAKGYLKGIMAVTSEELVSSDFSGNPYSVIVDAGLTQICGRMAKVFGWYDNEWAYSVRLKDFLVYAESQGN
jgi:glyceraldehyde 3-phosphate dehydrogenase